MQTSLWREFRDLFKLGLPLMGAQVFILSMLMVDNLMVGHVSREALGAVSLGTGLYSIFFVTGIGIIIALSPMVTHRYGADAYAGIGKVIHQGFYVAIGISIIMIVLLWNSRYFLKFFGQDPELIGLAESYLRIMCLGVPGVFGFICMRQLTEGISDAVPSIVFAFIACLINAAVDYTLIFGNYGFPKLGVVGSGIATSTANWSLFAMALLYVRFNSRYDKFNFWKWTGGPDKAYLKEILEIGIPYAGSLIMEIAYFSATTFFMGWVGKTELAGHQVALNAASMTFMVPLGLSFALGIRVGQFVGREDMPGARISRRAGFYTTIIIQTLLGLGFLLGANRIARAYTPDQEVIDWAVKFLRIAGVFQIFDGLQVLGMGALRGLKDTVIPFLFNFVAYWVVGAGLSFLFFKIIGPEGVWYGMAFGLGFAAVAHHVRFSILSRRGMV